MTFVSYFDVFLWVKIKGKIKQTSWILAGMQRGLPREMNLNQKILSLITTTDRQLDLLSTHQKLTAIRKDQIIMSGEINGDTRSSIFSVWRNQADSLSQYYTRLWLSRQAIKTQLVDRGGTMTEVSR